ncbi:hypothetical protein Tco_0940600 [Tanacetum coccineum]|uniref:Uncharacterized protein n=1 Tax=Tanacetum coccineum TaxID=301880 RepID=A0ABQ5DP22_9ASTR
MFAYSISSRGQAPEKVTDVDLFYLCSMDRGTTNVPSLLAQYIFRHAEGRKSGARLSGGHFIGRLAMHFGLVSDEGFERVAGVVESFTTEQFRVSTLLITCMTQLMDVSGLTYQAFDSTLVGISRMPYQRRVRPRTCDARTSAAPHTDDQPDP